MEFLGESGGGGCALPKSQGLGIEAAVTTEFLELLVSRVLKRGFLAMPS